MVTIASEGSIFTTDVIIVTEPYRMLMNFEIFITRTDNNIIGYNTIVDMKYIFFFEFLKIGVIIIKNFSLDRHKRRLKAYRYSLIYVHLLRKLLPILKYILCLETGRYHKYNYHKNFLDLCHSECSDILKSKKK